MHNEPQAKKPEPIEPPDVPYFARKGGWKSSDPEGYWLGPELHSGNSTASYSHFFILGLAKEIEDVQYFCASRAPNAKSGDVHKVFPKLPDRLLNLAVAAVHVAEAPVRTPAGEIARQMAEQWFNEEVCKIEPKLKRWPPTAPAPVPELATGVESVPSGETSVTERLAAERLAAVVARKLADPAAYPTMSPKEAAQALSKSVDTIRRYCEDETLQRNRTGSILTASVILLLEPPKDEYQVAKAQRDKAFSELKSTGNALTPAKYAEQKRAIEGTYDRECQRLDKHS